MAITRVWIEAGCIMCGQSGDTCSAVFELSDDADSTHVKTNVDLSQHESQIKEAAENCPVDVIKYEEG